MTRDELLLVAKPILFNTEMVKSEQSGAKTATRRIVKPQPKDVNVIIYKHPESGKWFISPDDDTFSEVEVKPQYNVGDILYVREAWCKLTDWEEQYPDDEEDMQITYYRADYPEDMWDMAKWRPSIHMPKEAARVFLRVTDVRAERLQDIKKEDIIKEGVAPKGLWTGGCKCKWAFDGCLEEPCTNRDAYEEMCYMKPFEELWDSTIKKSDLNKYGFTANPWVWVYEFERLEVD